MKLASRAMAVPSPADFSRERRKLIVGLAAASLTLLSGCGMLPRRQQSDLDIAFADLDELLAQDQGQESGQITAIVQSISSSARQLIQNQREFIEAFNEAASRRSVPAAQLQQQAARYDEQRRSQRNELLQLQDQLHQLVPPELWPEVQAVLNRKGQAIGTSNMPEA